MRTQGQKAELAVSYADVADAAQRIAGVAHRTPTMTSTTADATAGASLVFKCENLQRAGAFKFRGAYNAVASLSADERERGVIAYSSGNHAQALALACQLQGVSAKLVMPLDAPEMKVLAARAYGGEVIFYDRYVEDRQQIARRIAAETGRTLISSHDNPAVIAGQGTAAKELFEATGPLDRVFVALGGGSALAGAALVAQEMSPGCKVVGVEPEVGDKGRQSLNAGKVIRIPVPKSIADGAIVTHIGAANFPIINALVDDIVTVSEERLVQTMRFFAERMKIIVEPTGCLAAAAVLSRQFHRAGERIGVIISGGNVDMQRFGRLVGA